MRAQIVTEGKTDEILLNRLLRRAAPLADFEVRAAGGRSSAVSLARSLLRRGSPVVALVVDSDTTDERRIHEEQSLLDESLREAAIPEGQHFAVFLMIPEIEKLLFADRAAAEALLGTRLSEADWVRSQFEPKKVLAQYAPAIHQDGGRINALALDDFLQQRDLTAATQSDQVQQLSHFIAADAAARR